MSLLLKRLSISSSSYYYASEALNKVDKYKDVREVIEEEFLAANASRGYRYVYRRLLMRNDVLHVGEKKVREIMKEQGLVPVYVKKKRANYNSYTGEHSKAPDNLVQRKFSSDAPNKLWLTDISEFKLPDDKRKVYLSVIIDCFDGMATSWQISTSPNSELANNTLSDACKQLRPKEAPIIHFDRGNHYRWPKWIEICKEHGLTRSMSKLGCSPDNSACEGFFGRLKNEFFYYRDWTGVSADDFILRLDAYIHYYNEERIKQSLGWLSPKQYRETLQMAA